MAQLMRLILVGSLLYGIAFSPASFAGNLCLLQKLQKLRQQLSTFRDPSQEAKREVMVSEVNRAPDVARLRERYKVFNQINEADNAHYIEVSQASSAVNHLYFEAENAVHKQLNDTGIRNKDTVDAVNNLCEQI
jgi:hypothetical protein